MLRRAAEYAGKQARASEQGLQALQLAAELRRDSAWSWLVNAFGQPFRGWNDGQDTFLVRLFGFWASGELAVGQISVGTTPGPDADRRGNQAKLDVLPQIGANHPDGAPGFSAFVEPHQHCSPYGDGWFHWSGEIRLGIAVTDRPEAEAWAHIDPLDERAPVPLEIGYTNPQTTYLHLQYRSGLARWAYGSTEVVLLVPSNFVREASLAQNPAIRWKPQRMWRPADELPRLVGDEFDHFVTSQGNPSATEEP